MRFGDVYILTSNTHSTALSQVALDLAYVAGYAFGGTPSHFVLQLGDHVLYTSAPLGARECSYDMCETCYCNVSSSGRRVTLSNLNINVSSPTHFQIVFYNNQRNLQLELPLNLTVSFAGNNASGSDATSAAAELEARDSRSGVDTPSAAVGCRGSSSDTACKRRTEGRPRATETNQGLMVVVTNKHTAQGPGSNFDSDTVTLTYESGATNKSGTMVLDDAIFSPYTQTPDEIPWQQSGLQRAEYEVFAATLDHYILRPARNETVKMHVPWTANFLEVRQEHCFICASLFPSVLSDGRTWPHTQTHMHETFVCRCFSRWTLTH